MPRVSIFDTNFIDRKAGTPAYAGAARGLPQHEGLDSRHVYFRDNESVREILDDTLHAGVLDAITVTDTGGLGVEWTGGELYTPPQSPDGVGTIVVTEAGSGTCTNDAVNYLVWESGTTLTLRTTPPDPATEVNIAHISCADADGAGDIWDIDTQPIVSDTVPAIVDGLANTLGVVVTSGCAITPTNPTVDAEVSLSTGVYIHEAINKHSVTGFDTSTASTLVRCYVDGAGPSWRCNTGFDEADLTQYNTGNALVPTNPAKYYRGLFIISEGYVHWIYGQVQYNTLNAALEAPDPTTPAGLAINPKSAAYIYQSGETALEVASSDRWIDRRPILAAGEGAVASGGGLANVVEDNTPQLGGDLDVNGNGIVSVSDGNINLAPDGTGEAQVGGVEIVTLSASQTLSNKTLVVPSIFDASADDRYIVVPGELTANRIILLPALTGNDTFVFATHAQTLANKTLTTPTIGSMTNAQHDHADAAGGGVLALQRPRATILRMTPPGTDFAYQVNITGNSTPAENYTVWAFAGDDSLILDIKGILSEDYAGGGLTVKLCISNQSADAGSEQTRWVGAFRRYEANAAPLTTLFNYVTNAQGVSIDVASAAGEPMYGEIVFTSGAQMNGLLFGEQFLFRLYRDDDHADDDPTDLAYLHGIEIRET